MRNWLWLKIGWTTIFPAKQQFFTFFVQMTLKFDVYQKWTIHPFNRILKKFSVFSHFHFQEFSLNLKFILHWKNYSREKLFITLFIFPLHPRKNMCSITNLYIFFAHNSMVSRPVFYPVSLKNCKINNWRCEIAGTWNYLNVIHFESERKMCLHFQL